MKSILYILSLILAATFQGIGQETVLTPKNNPVGPKMVESESYKMAWYMLNGDQRMDIGLVQTEIQENGSEIVILTTVDMQGAPTTWVDSTIVEAKSFKPIYHASYNPQRDMVLQFSKEVTGYYLDKASNTKKEISEEVDEPFFDSNFYPQLIRWLPLKVGYSTTIAIFDYNPKSEIGVMTATIKNTEQTSLMLDGTKKRVWKVTVTDDISKNTAVSTYYIDQDSRKVLKQEIEVSGRKMIMERID